MSAFRFQLETLLEIRCRERDKCQQALADVVRRERALDAQARLLNSQRVELCDHLRRLQKPGTLDIHANAALREYDARLQRDISALEQERSTVSERSDRSRAALISADRAVRTLEKLADRHQAELAIERERRAARETEDAVAVPRAA